jgi:hypothetical protein
MRRRLRPARGFVITTEFIIIFSILLAVLAVGFTAIRAAVFQLLARKQAAALIIEDSADPPHILGKPRDFDEFEAPRVFFMDPPFWVLLGVRNDRFTSEHQIFYTEPNCTGSPCILGPGQEPPVEDIQIMGDGLDGLATPPGHKRGGVGYLYSLEEDTADPPNKFSYGVGADLTPVNAAARFPGTLYRSTTPTCDSTAIRSAWSSELVVAGEPCEPQQFPEVVADAIGCSQGNPAGCPGNQAPPCVDDPGDSDMNGRTCECPAGFIPLPNITSNSCCPAGSTHEPGAGPGQCRRTPDDIFVAEPLDILDPFVIDFKIVKGRDPQVMLTAPEPEAPGGAPPAVDQTAPVPEEGQP